MADLDRTHDDEWTCGGCDYSNRGPICTHCGGPDPRTQPTDDGRAGEVEPARKVVRLEVEYVRAGTVEFDFPDFAKEMGEAGWGNHAVGVLLRQMWVKAYHQRQSMQERVNFQQWRVVDLCDPQHQGFEYEHEKWERVPPFEDVMRCSRCGYEMGK